VTRVAETGEPPPWAAVQSPGDLNVSAGLAYSCPMPWWVVGRAATLEGEALAVERLKARDEAAFEELVGRHEREVFQLARRLLGDHEEALDATQEVFLRVFRGLPSFRGQATLRTWIWGIALNVCRTRLGSAQRRLQHHRTPLLTVDREGDECPLPLPDASPGPEQATYGGELRRALERALAALSPEHREVVVLRDVHGLEYEEIAAVLGCALGTVKSRLGRARAALRQALEGVWP